MSKNIIQSIALFLFYLSGQTKVQATKGVPTVVFHGMRDNCDNNRKLIEVLNEGTGELVDCIEIGDGINTSVWTKFLD